MSIRVSSNQMVANYQQQLNGANSRQTKLMEQGDGSKLHRPSDDSVAYAKYLRYDISSNENTQYQNNVSTAVSWMKTSDAALVNMTSIQTTFKEKTVAAANSTNNTSDMQATGKEMLAEIQEMVSLGNTQQGDRYVFSGQSDLTQPFTMSTETVDRGLAKTLDDTQAAFFNTTDNKGSMTQMLTMTGSDGNTYYLNTTNGKLYSKDFVDSGYKDKIAGGQTTVQDGDEVGTISGFGTTYKVSDYFQNTGKIKTGTDVTTAASAALKGVSVTTKDTSGTATTSTVDFSFKTISQNIVTYNGDEKHISMVKQNGAVDPASDTVNVTGSEIFGSDIFDNSSSGNSVSGSAMLNNMLTVYTKTNAADNTWLTTDGQTLSDTAHSTTVNIEGKLGARQALYTSVSTMLDNQSEIITSDITDVSSTDVAALAVKLMQEQTIYNMSLSLGARILPKSLSDYLS
ncbi:MAG: flagellar hook-associated protein 3 [Selenomonas sp.]|jgi:flagellar hook-associated protein 3 FlgL|nr:flagellar hook-associated protein 3 [Selenomonas sp.]